MEKYNKKIMYEVKVSPKIRECLKLANCLEEKEWVPIDLVEKATKINSANVEIPIDYQNVWFCLHQQILRKTTIKGYKTVKVLFPPARVENNKKILNLVKRSIKKVGLETFGMLCMRGKWSVYRWLKKKFIPLTAVIKACQLLGKDVWQAIDNCNLSGTYHSIIYQNKLTSTQKQDLRDIIDWINTEGSISINGWSITIHQRKENREILEEIKKKFMNVFGLKESMIHMYDYRNMTILSISSSVVKQILVLKYGIPLGAKSEIIKISRINWKTVANYLITEGCFYLNGRGTGLAIAISSKSDDVMAKIRKFLKENKFHPSKSESKNGKQVVVQRKTESLRLLNILWPYLNLSKKIQACKILKNPKVFLSLKVDRNKISPLINEFVTLHGKDKFLEMINDECKNYHLKGYSKRSIEHWIYPNDPRDVPLFLAKKLCEVMGKNISNFIDPNIIKIFNVAEDFSQSWKVV